MAAHYLCGTVCLSEVDSKQSALDPPQAHEGLLLLTRNLHYSLWLEAPSPQVVG